MVNIWQSLSISKDIVLVAVGGYGRKELFPFSDVDILIVFEKEISKADQEAISQFITNCWDLGLKIGHSVRNIKQTKQEFNADISTATNLIESRFLIGSSIVFHKMNQAINTGLSVKRFYKLKLQEQADRHRKYRDSAYQLEPNIKESPGGLRDLHMIRWLSISQGKGSTFKEMLENNLIDKVEFNKVQLHENKITKRRILLHILAKRIEDRLVFDVQNELADNLGFQNTKNKKSSEIVMKSYYKSVNYITLFNEIIIKRLDPNTIKKKPIKHKLPFYTYNDLLEFKLGVLSQHQLEQVIIASIKQDRLNKMIELPGFISKLDDFYCFEYHSAQANFITNKQVSAKSKILTDSNVHNLDGYIILIQQADPGYDWLFGHDIAGLITQYGGANSHMAIKTAELGIPAVIGVGEKIYKQLSSSHKLKIDCGNRNIVVIL
jgi:UTP:GlnB (protein PII) uridylyltransferase/phosphohistidine swiveling domain-containing protein